MVALIAVDDLRQFETRGQRLASAICRARVRDAPRPGAAGASQLMIGRARDIL
jgi:hypothetical protein